MDNNISKVRRKLKMSQRELAEKTKVTETTIRNIEKNRNIPNVEIAIKIAKALNITVEELFIIE